jgi:hypothetical protein
MNWVEIIIHTSKKVLINYINNHIYYYDKIYPHRIPNQNTN